MKTFTDSCWDCGRDLNVEVDISDFDNEEVREYVKHHLDMTHVPMDSNYVVINEEMIFLKRLDLLKQTQLIDLLNENGYIDKNR